MCFKMSNKLRFYNELKVKSCKLYNDQYMMALTQITNAEIFAFLAVPGFKLLSRKVLFIKEKTIETVKKSAIF